MRTTALHLTGFVVVIGVALLVGSVLVSGSVADEHDANISLYTTDEGTFEDATTIETAIENGTLESTNQTLYGEDTLVVALESDALADDLEERNGTTSERFFAALDDDLTFALVQANPSPMMNALKISVGPDNTTVQRNDTTTYVSIETAETELEWLGDAVPDPELRGDETFEVGYGYNLGDDEHTETSPEIEFLRTGAEFVTAPDPSAPEVTNVSVGLYTVPDDAAVVRATLDDGTQLNGTVDSASRMEKATVPIDFRDVEPGTEYTLELLFDGDVVDERNNTVQAVDGSLANPEVQPVAEDGPLGELTVDVTVSHDGYVDVRDETGEQISTRNVGAGESTALTLPLPPDSDQMAEFDPEELHVQVIRYTADGDRQFPGADATLTIDVADIEWATATPTPTETPTPHGHTPTPTPHGHTPTPTPVEPSTPTPTETPSPTPGYTDLIDDDGSGFTPFIAILALLAVIVAGLRRTSR